MRSHSVRLFDESIVPGLYDFDTGRQPVPARVLVDGSADGVPSEELLAWAEREGVDLVAMKTKLPGFESPCLPSNRWGCRFGGSATTATTS